MTTEQMAQQLELLENTREMLVSRLEEVEGLIYEIEQRLDHSTQIYDADY